MNISWMSLRVTVTETALPNLILTPSTCRISTLVKLNSEFEMGLEWARKWEAEFIYWSQKLPTFTQEGRGPSPTSPGCKCRRCSLLHIDECDPKEVSSLFKFLRKRKVNCPELSENQWEISGQCSARCGSGGPYPVFWHYLRLAWYRGQIECSDDVKWHKACWPRVAGGVLCGVFAQVIKEQNADENRFGWKVLNGWWVFFFNRGVQWMYACSFMNFSTGFFDWII